MQDFDEPTWGTRSLVYFNPFPTCAFPKAQVQEQVAQQVTSREGPIEPTTSQRECVWESERASEHGNKKHTPPVTSTHPFLEPFTLPENINPATGQGGLPGLNALVLGLLLQAPSRREPGCQSMPPWRTSCIETLCAITQGAECPNSLEVVRPHQPGYPLLVPSWTTIICPPVRLYSKAQCSQWALGVLGSSQRARESP